jgi:hypothetical protein
MVVTTTGEYFDAKPATPYKLSVTLKHTAKGTSTAPVPAASMEAASRRTSPGALGDVSDPLSVAPNGSTLSTAQADWTKSILSRSDATKARCSFLG